MAKQQKEFNINELEIIEVWCGLQAFSLFASRMGIRLVLDNTTVCLITKEGATKSRDLTKITKAIIDWCESRHFRF